MAKCTLCSATDVIWARTTDKKSVPVVADPRGSGWFVGDGKDRHIVFASHYNPRPAQGRFFRLHFIDCPGHKGKERIKRALRQTATEDDE